MLTHRPIHRFRHAALAWVLLAALFTGLAPSARAQSQTDITTPTDWWYMTFATNAQVNDRVNLGYRLVDIEIRNVSPIRFSATFVRNAGDYAKGWYWYHGLTASGVNSALNQNNARLIDIEPYETSNGLRFAVVMIRNTGQDLATTPGWAYGFTANEVGNWANSNSAYRILDVQPYQDSGQLRYAFHWVHNSGNVQSSWWYAINATITDINNVMSNQQARLIDLERQENGRYSAILTPRDGRAWYWYRNLTDDQLSGLAEQRACRIIDLERRVAGTQARYDVILRQNDNDLAVATSVGMRSGLPLGASSGFLLRELDSTPTTRAGVFENTTFEPASLMKTAHHFHAMRQVRLGLDSLGAQMVERTGLNGSCPTGSNPVTRSLSAVLRRMMEQSSNTATEAIRARYGTASIEATANAYGADGIELNHTLGCFCSSTRNEATLRDFSDLHQAVVNGALGGHRDTFYDLMSNGTEFGMGSSSTASLLNQRMTSSSLSTSERAAFLAGLRIAQKGGSYSCTSGSGAERHRSRGAYVRVPYRSGCQTIYREYFLGAWVNDATTSSTANDAVGIGVVTLLANLLDDAIGSWENASCTPFVNYCQAAPNMTGLTGEITATGTSFILEDNLVLRGRHLPTNSFGFLMVSRTQGFVPMAGGGQGNLCLGGTIGRYFSSIASTGSQGTLAKYFDPEAFPTPSGAPDSVSPGDTLYFQWWSRDSTPAGMATSNFSNGLRVTFI